MTVFHTRVEDLEFGYTDDQLIEHLKSSECTECVNAGFRFKALLEAYEELLHTNKLNVKPVSSMSVEERKRLEEKYGTPTEMFPNRK